MEFSEDINLTKLYNIVVNTLIMVCCDLKTVTDEIIADHLDELEGDNYTFFHHSNLILLLQANILTQTQVDHILKIRKLIDNIHPKLWNTNSFKIDTEWTKARKIANDVLNSLQIHRRIIE